VSGFKSIKLWTFNPGIFSAEDFRASLVTDESHPSVNHPLFVESNMQVDYFSLLSVFVTSTVAYLSNAIK